MKILKVELQNLNSLKSDSAIVIDFESEQFKDVGLYAITGSTGAGKTTILDAITIALYHSVPRFNQSKGTLLDVVSHGALEAFSRVTFENEHEVYEAYWGIRLASNTGKILKNPQEEVSIKNLTTGAILASQKRAVIDEVIRVSQLDYVQFLRSVMLAQGEFASFLTAKGPEKGRLLEQITGEQIYKKIGQGILDRKSSEENKLREIQSKINSEDVLTEERKIEITRIDKELDIQILTLNKELESIQIIVNWYEKYQELTVQSEKIDQESSEINTDFENHKTEFHLLELNQKAEPFKELIQTIHRNENNRKEKTNQLKALENQLHLLKPEIARLTELNHKQTIELGLADQNYSNWQPKFDSIIKLDGQLKNEADNQLKTKEKREKIKQQAKELQHTKKKLIQDLTDIEIRIKEDEAFTMQNSFLMAVSSEISNWTTDLIHLKTYKESLNENSVFVAQKKKEVENSTTELTNNQELLQKKLAEIEKIEIEIKAVDEQLSNNNLTALLAKKEEISTTKTNWQHFKTLAEERIKEEKDYERISNQKKVYFTDLEEVRKQIDAAKKQITLQEASVADAEKILDLEKSISKYENDRKNLEPGRPCGLCGSLEHPFAQATDAKGVSKAEFEVSTRRDQLKTLVTTKSELDKKEVKLATSIESLALQIASIADTLKSILLKAKDLIAISDAIDCDLTHLAQIEIGLNQSSENLKAVHDKIITAQKLQSSKDSLSASLKVQNQSIESLKTKDATLREKIKNADSEINTKQKTIDNLAKTCSALESELTSKLAEYKYKVPSIMETKSFIQTIENAIQIYHKTQKNLDESRAKVTVITNNKSNIEKQVEELAKTYADYTAVLAQSEANCAQWKAERIDILPIEVTVESKRQDLQSARNTIAQQIDINKKVLQKQLDANTEQEALRIANKEDQKRLVDEFDTLNSTLERHIKGSDFASRQDIEKALLSAEDKTRYSENKERIKEKQLRLKTLKETNLQGKDELHKSKNFETTADESRILIEEYKSKKDKLSTEKGKILEAFRKDQEIRDRNQEIYKKIDAQEIICGTWKELFKIIGNSKDAFNVYVQRLTLKHLLDLANVHLYKLNERYSLKMEELYKPNEELNFNLIDHYQTDQARLVDTSSGGEKFIISLALALGLSDLASKNVKIDSLFIDEGFGTLDKNTLETVISTLETLQSQGKIIGIISHVENLKERIPTQIQITKKSNGVSTVKII